MRRGTTKSGFTFEIDEQDLNDYRFLKLLAKAQKDALAFSDVLERMLGAEQEEKLCKHLEDEKGHVPMDALSEIVAEIMTLAGDDTKNS